MKLLVTGGAGFIGSNFIHHLFHTYGGVDASACCPDHARYGSRERRDLQVLNVDTLTYAGDLRAVHPMENAPGYRFARTDICDAQAMDALFREFRPDAVVHFAAESHVDRSIEAGDVFVRTNVMGTQVLLDLARRHDTGHFLHVSTDEVYGSIAEGSAHENSPYNPSSPYSASKAGSDLLVLAHRHTYGLPVTLTRCTNNYGPRQNPEKLLPKIVSNASRDEPLPIYGTGLNMRDWLYVKDHCAAIDLVLGWKGEGEVYNIGGRDERTNLDVARIVLKTLGKPESLIRFVKDRPGHDWRYSLDDAKLRAKGWAPRTGFDQGLLDLIRWIREGGAA